nr:MAG: RNA-dependent RNA polymerase [Drosophila Inverleith totivirus]
MTVQKLKSNDRRYDYISPVNPGPKLPDLLDLGYEYPFITTEVRPQVFRDLGAGLDKRSTFELLSCSIPCAIPAECRLEFAPYNFSLWDLAVDTITPWSPEKLKCFSNYTQAPPGIRQFFQVNPVHVCYAIPNRMPIFGLVAAINRECYAYELAGLFMWWGLMPDDICLAMLDMGVHRVNVNDNSSAIASRLEVIRLQGAANNTPLGEQLFYWLRKWGNLKGRRLGGYDAESERVRGHPGYALRSIPSANGGWSYKAYRIAFRKHVQAVCDGIVAAQVRGNSRQLKLDDWWSMRKFNTPGGSSSERHRLDVYKEVDTRTSKDDRPNKKSVVESLDELRPWEVFCTIPHEVARRSTKNEPGKKMRALYASDDASSLIAAFASDGLEKHMAIEGMCPQQRPADIVAWWRQHDTKTGGMWLSADFTDFNKEHGTEDLVGIKLAMAKAWNRLAPSNQATQERVLAWLWMAAAHRRRFFKDQQEDCGRCFSGLWSGSRNTASDNTILHRVYTKIALEVLEQEVPNWGTCEYMVMCGDDEDAYFSSPLAAGLYFWNLRRCGWHLNAVKQMAGYAKHEFLQKVPHATQGVLGPISSMIAAMASGQWYKQPGVHQDAAVAAISDQSWELVVRGADPLAAIRLCEEVLNSYMHAQDVDASGKKTRVPLEWYSFRKAASSYTTGTFGEAVSRPCSSTRLLWGPRTPGDDSKEQPAAFVAPPEKSQLPGKATAAWCNRVAHFFKDAEPRLLAQYGTVLKEESHSTLISRHLQAAKQRYMSQKWPRRDYEYGMHEQDAIDRADEIKKAREDAATHTQALHALWHHDSGRATPLTEAQLISKAGFEATGFHLLGGWKNKELVHELNLGRFQGRIASPWSALLPKLGSAMTLCDPALRSHFNTNGPRVY